MLDHSGFLDSAVPHWHGTRQTCGPDRSGRPCARLVAAGQSRGHAAVRFRTSPAGSATPDGHNGKRLSFHSVSDGGTEIAGPSESTRRPTLIEPIQRVIDPRLPRIN